MFLVLGLIGVCILSSYLAYRAGFAQAKQLQKRTFVLSLGILEKLRSGDVSDATRKTETLCFSAAEMLYSDPNYRDQTVTRSFAPELIRYRAAYRTNHSEWTVTEEKLEKDLTNFSNLPAGNR